MLAAAVVAGGGVVVAVVAAAAVDDDTVADIVVAADTVVVVDHTAAVAAAAAADTAGWEPDIHLVDIPEADGDKPAQIVGHSLPQTAADALGHNDKLLLLSDTAEYSRIPEPALAQNCSGHILAVLFGWLPVNTHLTTSAIGKEYDDEHKSHKQRVYVYHHNNNNNNNNNNPTASVWKSIQHTPLVSGPRNQPVTSLAFPGGYIVYIHIRVWRASALLAIEKKKPSPIVWNQT